MKQAADLPEEKFLDLIQADYERIGGFPKLGGSRGLGFRDLGFRDLGKIRVPFFGGSYNKDCFILGFIFGQSQICLISGSQTL